MLRIDTREPARRAFLRVLYGPLRCRAVNLDVLLSPARRCTGGRLQRSRIATLTLFPFPWRLISTLNIASRPCGGPGINCAVRASHEVFAPFSMGRVGNFLPRKERVTTHPVGEFLVRQFPVVICRGKKHLPRWKLRQLPRETMGVTTEKKPGV